MKLLITLFAVLIATQSLAQRPTSVLIFEIHGSHGEIQGTDTNYTIEAVCDISFIDSTGLNEEYSGKIIDLKNDSCYLNIQFVEGKTRMFNNLQLVDGYWEFSWDLNPFILKRKIKITERSSSRIMYIVIGNESRPIDYLRLNFEPGEYLLMTKSK